MEAKALLGSCVLCGHRCKVDRLKGERGVCGAGFLPEVSSYCLHHGEEPMISGSCGSGTIFFAHCCLSCVYCQNYEISQGGMGCGVWGTGTEGLGTEGLGTEGLIEIMMKLQARGAHNINLVSPTHYGVQIMEALKEARQSGLKIPAVWNSGGYDSLELLRALDGLIDIYMPDFKYFDDSAAAKYSQAKNYVQTAKAAVAEMFKQVGNIKLKSKGYGVRGILVRHLVLPNGLSQSERVLDFLASISKDVWVSLMAQYSPQHKAKDFPELARKLTAEEYSKIVDHAEKLGSHNIYVQALESSETYLPDFRKEQPF